MWKFKTFSVTVSHYTSSSQKIKPPIFYFMLFTSRTCENFKELHYHIAEGTVGFPGSLHLGLHSFFHLQTKACIPTQKKLCSLFSSHWCTAFCTALSLGSWCPHWHFSKDQASSNLMVNDQDFRLDLTTLPIQNSRWPLFLGREWHYSCGHLTYGENTKLWLPYLSTIKPGCSPSSELIPQQKSLECCCSIAKLGHTQVHAPQRPSYILDGQCFWIHAIVFFSFEEEHVSW